MATDSSYSLEDNSNKTMNEQENKSLVKQFLKPILAELFGTMFFILIGLFGACSEENSNNSLIAGFSFGFSLMISIASLGQISGGHFNPAVTLGVFIAGGIEIKKAIVYIFIQLIGGIMAAGIFRLLAHANMYQFCHGGATSLANRIHWWEGILIELSLTFIFLTMILMITMNKKNLHQYLAPIYIGCTLSVCIFASNSLTGGSLNPARSLGPAIFSNTWAFHYVYWLGPLIGASLAGSFYRFIWRTNEQ